MVNSDVTVPVHADVSSSGISWTGVIAGAFVAAAISLAMLALGAGFELSAISPWSNPGESARGVGTGELIWLIATQIVASSLGGYLAGRLRIRWHSIHSNEVHFRDTANGLLAWAVSMILAAAFLGAAASVMAGTTAVRNVGAVDRHEAPSGFGYYADHLFPPDRPVDSMVHDEADRTIEHILHGSGTSSSDETFLAQLVAGRSGLSEPDAAKRVSDTIAEARQTADTLRKAAARILLWTFLGLLLGAFCASYGAVIGGRQRDHVQII